MILEQKGGVFKWKCLGRSEDKRTVEKAERNDKIEYSMKRKEKVVSF